MPYKRDRTASLNFKCNTVWYTLENILVPCDFFKPPPPSDVYMRLSSIFVEPHIPPPTFFFLYALPVFELAWHCLTRFLHKRFFMFPEAYSKILLITSLQNPLPQNVQNKWWFLCIFHPNGLADNHFCFRASLVVEKNQNCSVFLLKQPLTENTQ